MKFVIQRVNHASCIINGETFSSVSRGYCVLIGISDEDTEAIADKMISKMVGLRIFPDAEGKTNCSLKDVGGSLLLISQFTLYADCKKGNRPSFINAGKPDKANQLYEYIIAQCKTMVDQVETGVFGEHMHIELDNDGPFTIVLDSKEIMPGK